MEATVLSLAKHTLDTVLPVAKNALADEAMLLLGVHEEVSFIANELEMMQAFLRAAGAGDRACNEVVKIWVKQVRDLAYDVEDCLQEYLALDLGTAGCDLPLLARWPRACAIPAAGQLRAQHHIAVRIRQVKGRVEEVSKRNLRYSIVAQPATPLPPHTPLIEDLIISREFAADIAIEESQLVGRDHQRAELVSRLVGSPSSTPLQVLGLWGMGGMGKTVLARDVLRSSKLGQAFQLRAWVTVPHPFVMAEFLWSFASQLGMKDSGVVLASPNYEPAPAHTPAMTVRQCGAANLTAEVVRQLGDKRYAIVVDDVSTVAEWEQIKKVMPDMNRGSWVIVTTRDEGVAIHCSTSSSQVYGLNYLSHAESFQLLCKKAQIKDGPLMEELLEKANPILQRCCGLPLAVAAVGKLLATKMKTPVEWKKLHDHLGTELKDNPGLEEIKNVLTSSYDGLPYHLKSCFLYISIFPKYRELRQTRVSWRWMAEGLVAESSDSDPEDVGENYFNQLISRSMIQPATTWVNLDDRINTGQVHDMMREIILAKSAEENQLFIILNGRLPSMLSQEKVRHLVISGNQAGSDVLEGVSNMSHVRSLTVDGECPPRLIIPSKMKMIRVLDLEDCLNATDTHLADIGELRHLRYLGLRRTGITRLPESLGRLKFLRSLDVRGTKVTTVPQGITKLEKLRHLLAGNGMWHDDNMITSQQSKPSSVQRAMSSITGRAILLSSTTLWHRAGSSVTTAGQHSGVRLPDGFGRLRGMHNLGRVDVGRDGQRTLKEIRKLAGLSNLKIAELADRDGPEFRDTIHELVGLRELEVRSRASKRGSLRCLRSITTPPPHLVTLRLCGYLGELPRWIGSLRDITKIKLLATELEQDAVEVLGDLPNLTGLHLWRKSYVGQELRLGAGKFAKLKLIDVNRLEDLASLVIEDASTPQLERIWLYQCRRLSNGEDGVVGVPLLPKLKEIRLKFCGDKPKLEDILQRQLGNHQNCPQFECQ